MDASEATKVVMSRIKSLDPENASKIMGYILIQDQGDKEMIRLAFGPEALLLSHVNQARACLGLSSLTSPCSNTNPSPRILVPNNGFLSNPASPATAFQRPFSYAAAVNGSNAGGNSTASGSTSGSPRLQFYGGNEFLGHTPVQEHLPLTEDLSPMVSPSGRSDSMVYPYGEDMGSRPSPPPHSHSHPFHRRSCSVNDAAFLSSLEEGGFLWRPCVYFARGFCKNGSTCKFLHSDNVGVGEGIEVGSPNKIDELLRVKALQNHRFAVMAGGGGHHPFGHHRGMDFLNENLRHDFASMGLVPGGSSSSRQIYLTFPADSTFKEEDVSNYFSTYGPVQDVRIPYQQKRMFGFVTFVYAETVKLILAKGNPHFVCDSRVLVKPYKEKGKLPDKKQQHQQHFERGDYMACLSPSGADSREHVDLPIGSRMLYDPQEMMLRRKLEEAELQHAIEFQSRRIMNLQLVDLKIQHHNNHFLPRLGASIPISSPRQSLLPMNQNIVAASDVFNQEQLEDFDGNQEASKSPVAVDQKLVLEGTDQQINGDSSDLPDSLEHILPDNFFASPTKSVAESHSAFGQASANDSIPVTKSSSNNTALLPSSSPLRTASLNSCYNQFPRFSSGQEAIEM